MELVCNGSSHNKNSLNILGKRAHWFLNEKTDSTYLNENNTL